MTVPDDQARRTATSLVVVGCSWGGLAALTTILRTIPRGLPAALALAQHLGPTRSSLAELLSPRSPWPVCEADDKMPLKDQNVFVAPSGYHLLIERDHLALSTEEPVRYSRPSIDVLFESATSFTGGPLVAVVLTGANDDGARGAVEVARRGGTVIVQDPETAERPEMPQAVLDAGVSAIVLPAEEIGACLAEVCRPREAEVPPWRTRSQEVGS